MGGSSYHFCFFQYFTSRKAAMKQIRTTGQCLMAHFQNGASSADKRRKNSVKRSITSQAGEDLLSDQLRCVVNESSSKNRSRIQCVNLSEKSRFYVVAVSNKRTNSFSELSDCETSGHMKGNLDVSVHFGRKGEVSFSAEGICFS